MKTTRQKGNATVEYALIIALVGGVAVSALLVLGVVVRAYFGSVVGRMAAEVLSDSVSGGNGQPAHNSPTGTPLPTPAGTIEHDTDSGFRDIIQTPTATPEVARNTATPPPAAAPPPPATTR
ncbi:MAG: hypothetical protein Kow0031_27010 [Anaerolineae bacterium]